MELSYDGEYLSHVVVLTVEEVLLRGLQVAGFSKKRINRVKKIDPLLSTTNHQRFKDQFEVSHVALDHIWKDPQKHVLLIPILRSRTQKIPRRMPKELNLLLHSQVFLKRYLTEAERTTLDKKYPKYYTESQMVFYLKSPDTEEQKYSLSK